MNCWIKKLSAASRAADGWRWPLTGKICIVYWVPEVLPCSKSSRWKLYCVHNEMSDVCGWFWSLSLHRPLIKYSFGNFFGLDGSDLCISDSKVLAAVEMNDKQTTHLLPLMNSCTNVVIAHFFYNCFHRMNLIQFLFLVAICSSDERQNTFYEIWTWSVDWFV